MVKTETRGHSLCWSRGLNHWSHSACTARALLRYNRRPPSFERRSICAPIRVGRHGACSPMHTAG